MTRSEEMSATTFPPQVEMWHREELAATPDDSELVRRWFQRLKADKHGRLLVTVVIDAFGVGSTAATEICRRHGYAGAENRLVRPPA